MKTDLNFLKRNYDELDIIKGIGIILVLIGHSIPDANTGIANKYWGGIFYWIYSFHMPLFIMASGFLFYNKSICDIFKLKFIEIKKRAIRLLIPYTFLSLFILTIKIFFSSLSRKPIDYLDIVGILFGNSPCGNMWFLWTLFIITTFILLIPKSKFYPLPLIVFSFFLYFFQNIHLSSFDFGLSKIFNMMIWFSIGLFIGKKIYILEKLHNLSMEIKVIVSFLLLSFQLILLNINIEYNLGLLLKFLISFSGILFILLISIIIEENQNWINSKLKIIGKNSMSIYIFSYFIQTPGVTIYRILGSCGIPYNVWVFLLTFLSFAFSYYATILVRKTKIFRLLLLGEV